MKKARFYLCKVCGNVIVKLVDSGVTPVCCGKDMVELKAGQTEGAGEKHVPVCTSTRDGILTVNIGSEEHPMTQNHWIQFIALETEHGLQIAHLTPDCKPTACFRVKPNDKPVTVYAYCNIHGLWESRCI